MLAQFAACKPANAILAVEHEISPAVAVDD